MTHDGDDDTDNVRLSAFLYDPATRLSDPCTVDLAADGLLIIVGGEDAFTWAYEGLSSPYPRDAQDRLALTHAGHGAIRLTLLGVVDPVFELLLDRAPQLRSQAVYTATTRKRRRFSVTSVLFIAFFVFLILSRILIIAMNPAARRAPPDLESRLTPGAATALARVAPSCAAGEARAALQAMADDIARAAHAPFPIAVDVVRTAAPRTWALPGGRIAVSHGLLTAAADPNAVAAVLAADIDHLARREVFAALMRRKPFATLAQAAAGDSALGDWIAVRVVHAHRFAPSAENPPERLLTAASAPDPGAWAAVRAGCGPAGRAARTAAQSVSPAGPNSWR